MISYYSLYSRKAYYRIKIHYFPSLEPIFIRLKLALMKYDFENRPSVEVLKKACEGVYL